MMPESFPGEHLYHAKSLVGKSGPELLQEVLRLTIYTVSNNILCLFGWQGKWKETSTLLSQSGVMSHRFDITTFHDTTATAFFEKVFQAAVYYAVTKDVSNMELRIIKWILSCGHDVNSPVPFKEYDRALTAFHASILWGRKNLVQFFLDHGSDINMTLSQRTPLELILDSLQYSSLCGTPFVSSKPYLSTETRLEVAYLLLSRGAAVNLPIRDGCEPALHLAFRLGDIDLVKTIQSHGPDPRLSFEPTRGLISEQNALCRAAGFEDQRTPANETALELVKNVLKSLTPRGISSSSSTGLITADVFISAAAAGNYRVVEHLSKLSRNFMAPNKFGVTALHAAVQSDKFRVCRLLLELGCPVTPSETSTDYLSPLHIACSKNNMAMVNLLLSYGADINACVTLSETVFERHQLGRDYDLDSFTGLEMWFRKITPLQLSLFSSSTHDDGICVVALVDAGAKLYGGEIPRATRYLEASIVSALINAGGDPNDRSPVGETPLQIACNIMDDEDANADTLNLVEILLEGGAALEGGELARAVMRGQWPLGRLLIKYGAKLATSDNSGLTGYEAVILSNRHRMIESVFRREKYDPGYLCAAVAMENEAMVRRLLSNRPAQRFSGPLEAAAIGLAAMQNDLSLLQLLVASLPRSTAGILPLEVRQYDGKLSGMAPKYPFWRDSNALQGSLLACAAIEITDSSYANSEEKKMDAFSYLLEHDYAPDWITWVCLAKYSRIRMASALLQKGYRVRSAGRRTSSACGPLYYAILNRSMDMVRLLLAAGSPINETVRDIKGGRTPLQLAVENADMDGIKILLDAGADVNAPAAMKSGATALQLAAIKGHLGIARLLLESKAEIDAPRALLNGRTALEGAAEHGRIDMIQFLLDHGARTDGTGRRQYAHSVRLAEKLGHFTAAELLKRHGGWTEADKEIGGDADNLGEEGRWSDEEDLDNIFAVAGLSTDEEDDDEEDSENEDGEDDENEVEEDGEDEDDEEDLDNIFAVVGLSTDEEDDDEEDSENEDGEDDENEVEEDGENEDDEGGDRDEENNVGENENNEGGRADVEGEYWMGSGEHTVTSGADMDQGLWDGNVVTEMLTIPDHHEEIPGFIDQGFCLEDWSMEEDIVLDEEYE